MVRLTASFTLLLICSGLGKTLLLPVHFAFLFQSNKSICEHPAEHGLHDQSFGRTLTGTDWTVETQ